MSVEDHYAEAQKLTKKAGIWRGIFGGGKRRRWVAEAQLHVSLAGQKQAERDRQQQEAGSPESPPPAV